MKSLKNKLETIKEKLEIKLEEREIKFEERSEKWQESENGQNFETETEMTQEIIENLEMTIDSIDDFIGE